MISTSLKTSNDVYHVPPRLFPFSPVQTEVDGEQQTLYRFTIDGVERELILTDESVRYGFFTTVELINVDEARQSEILVEVPIDDAIELGEDVILQNSNGEDESFPLYEVTVGGEAQRLVLAYRGSLNVFVDPNNPAITAVAVERTATKVEVIDPNF